MNKSETLFESAKQYIPGGVNSPVRAFNAVGGTPRFIQSAKGAFMTCQDGQEYLDFVGSWGPMILGHADSDVMNATLEICQHGLSFGAPTELEYLMAKTICDRIPSVDLVRMCNSGTEATMSAIRLARAYTGRQKILKFQGCYHGHSDSLLVKAGSGALTLGCPSSPGIPEEVSRLTLNIEFNNLEQVHEVFAAYGEDISCVIIEPIAGNMGCIPGEKDFLNGLRQVCTNYGTVLIFDEVMTGFRVNRTGAEGHYGIQPDLVTFGKIIGGGMPVGAFGGKKAIMEHLSPMGNVYQAGTLSGNPVAMIAGMTTLNKIDSDEFYQTLGQRTDYLVEQLDNVAQSCGIPMSFNHVPGMFGMFFTDKPVKSFDDVMACDVERFKKFFHLMLDRGVYLAPSAYEAGFLSIAHTQALIDTFIEKAESAFKQL